MGECCTEVVGRASLWDGHNVGSGACESSEDI